MLSSMLLIAGSNPSQEQEGEKSREFHLGIKFTHKRTRALH